MTINPSVSQQELSENFGTVHCSGASRDTDGFHYMTTGCCQGDFGQITHEVIP